MIDPARQLSRSHDVAAKVARLLQTRAKLAQEHFTERVQKGATRPRIIASQG